MITRFRRQALAPRMVSLFVILLAGCQPAAGSGSVPASVAVVATPPSSAGLSATAAPTQASSATPVATPTQKPAAIPRPTDIPTDGTCERAHSCLGLLGTGSHHTIDFKPGFSFAMPVDGWQNLSDEGGVLGLLPIDSPGDAIMFFREPKATSADGTAVFSVGIDVDAISAWLATNKDLSVGPSSRVSVGGLKGVRMEIEVAPSTAPTTDCPTRSCVAFMKGVDPAPVKGWQWDWAVATSERMRLDLLATSDGGVLAIVVDSVDGTTYDTMIKAADSMLGTVKFDKS